MGIGLASVGVLFDQQRLHAIGEGQGGDVAVAGGEFPRQELQPQPVIHDKISITGPFDVTGRGLVAMNFRPRLDDGSNGQAISRHVAGQVGQHREGGEYNRLSSVGLVLVGALATSTTDQRQQYKG